MNVAASPQGHDDVDAEDDRDTVTLIPPAFGPPTDEELARARVQPVPSVHRCYAERYRTEVPRRLRRMTISGTWQQWRR